MLRALTERPMLVFGDGEQTRDFTYVDDIVEGVVRIADNPARPDPDWSGDDPNPGTSSAPYRLQNIGRNDPVELLVLIEGMEGLHPCGDFIMPKKFSAVARIFCQYEVHLLQDPDRSKSRIL